MIPVSVISGLRFTQGHPFVTGVVIAVLLALATLAASRSRRSPQRKKALRAVSVALVIGAIGFYLWAYNTRTPGLADQVAKLAKHAAAEQAAKSDTVEAK
ncbi:hypothetical protein LZK66_00060 [Pseudomonas aeruginosa]|nr:hypothetical protein [Pseudomonas aeruginosa]